MDAGGVHGGRKPDKQIQDMVNQMRPLVEQQANKKFSQFIAVEYSTQVVSLQNITTKTYTQVAGVNYGVTVDVGNNKFLHLKIYEDLAGNYELTEIKEVDYH